MDIETEKFLDFVQEINHMSGVIIEKISNANELLCMEINDDSNVMAKKLNKKLEPLSEKESQYLNILTDMYCTERVEN